MTCNCDNDGSNEYIIELNQQGAPGVKGEQGEQGYSPVVDYTSDNNALQLNIVNEQNTVTTPEIPLKSYTDNQLAGKLNKDGSNADNPITINGIKLRDSGYSIRIESIYDGFITMGSGGTIIGTHGYLTLGNGNASSINLSPAQDGKAYYNNNEIATVNDIPTKTSDLTNDSGFITSSDLPTVGNGTITFTQGGVTKGTFTTNQSGNTTIELDAGGSELTNPLVISNEAGTRNLTLGINESNNKVIATYGIVSGGGGFNVPIHFLYSASNPLVLTEREDGLYTLSLNVDNDTIKVNQDGQLYADVQGGSSYTAGTGIDITNDTISVDSTVVALQSDLPTNYLTTDTSQTVTTGTKTMASGTSQVFVSGSSLDVRGNNTLFLRGASQAQGGYLGLAARSRDTVNDVAINVIRLQANTTGDLANLRLQGYDLYNNPYLYNGFTRLGQVSVSSGDINITTESGVELQYNGYEVATVNNIPDLSIINGGNANA